MRFQDWARRELSRTGEPGLCSCTGLRSNRRERGASNWLVSFLLKLCLRLGRYNGRGYIYGEQGPIVCPARLPDPMSAAKLLPRPSRR